MEDQTLIENVNDWHSCCGTSSDKRLLVFIANLSISFILLIFSMVRLIEQLPPDERSIYIGFISLVIGIWIKSPLS